MKYKVFLLLIILVGFSLNAQVVFNEVPKDKQLFGRDIQTNYGQINIDGYVNIGLNYDLEFSNWIETEAYQWIYENISNIISFNF